MRRLVLTMVVVGSVVLAGMLLGCAMSDEDGAEQAPATAETGGGMGGGAPLCMRRPA